MADYNKDLPAQAEEKLKVPEKKIEPEKEWAEFGKDMPKNIEEKEISKSDEEKITDEMRREIDAMESNDTLKEEAKKKALKIEFLGEKEKIENLLKIAREKGVVFATKIAKEMNDPYLLDIFHDILAREGFFQKMGQSVVSDDNNKDDNKK
jgi:hypothetical protein